MSRERVQFAVVVAAVALSLCAGLMLVSTQNLPPVVLAQSGQPIKPFEGILETASVLELVGVDEEVNTSDFGGSVAIGLPIKTSGRIEGICLYATAGVSGTIQDSGGVLLFLDADPATTAGDTSITAAERITVLGDHTFYASDWAATDANGSHACVPVSISFHAMLEMYAVWFHTDAVDINDGASDDEVLEFTIRYQRHS